MIQNFYKKIIKYDFLNKFNYKNINQIPKIEKIILNFDCKSFDLKKLAIAILTLELISTQKGILTKSKKASINLKIRKGHPVGCKVVLKKKKMEVFLSKLLNKIFPELKNFKGLIQKYSNINNFSFSIKDLINFNELNSNFYLFKNLPTLNVTVIYKTGTVKELNFFINSLKIPLINHMH